MIKIRCRNCTEGGRMIFRTFITVSSQRWSIFSDFFSDHFFRPWKKITKPKTIERALASKIGGSGHVFGNFSEKK
jgi:hypothetical protein